MTELRSATALAEVDALRAHFAAAIHLLRTHELVSLDPIRRATRALLLDEIEDYAARGVFPQGHFPGERRPTFIDDDGTPCAVARLMHVTGAESLALEVQGRMNFAAVPEIADDERVRQWAEAAGFTIEELAVVQPAYCDIPRTECVCEVARPLEANEALVVLELVSAVDQTHNASSRRTYRVAKVVESRLGVGVGALLELDDRSLRLMPSTMVRIVYNEDIGAFDVISSLMAPDPSTRPLCGIWASSALLMSMDEAKSALLSADPKSCEVYLRALDQRWSETGREIDPEKARCRNPEALAAYSRSCNTSLAPGEAYPVVMLAALLAALAMRRMARLR